MPHNGKILRLASNACTDLYPGNTAWSFKNAIDRYWIFGSSSRRRAKRTEIALTDLFVSTKYNNITDGHGFCKIWSKVFRRTDIVAIEEMEIPPGYYDNPSVIADTINRWLEAVSKTLVEKPELTILYSEETLKTKLEFRTKTTGIQFGADIARMFGLKDQQIYWPSANHRNLSSYNGLISGTTHSNRGNLFIYCPAIETNMMADRNVHLLQISPWSPSTRLLTYHQQFIHPVYHVIQDRGFDYLEIEIKDSSGMPVEFREGITICTFIVKELEE